MMEQKINEENIENNLVFLYRPSKAFAIKSLCQDLFLGILSHNIKIRLFSISFKFLFWFLYKTMKKQTVYLNNSARRVDLDCNFWFRLQFLPFKLTIVGEDDLSNYCWLDKITSYVSDIFWQQHVDLWSFLITCIRHTCTINCLDFSTRSFGLSGHCLH